MSRRRAAVQRYISAIKDGRIPSKTVIDTIFGGEDAGHMAAFSLEWAKRMLPLARLDSVQREQVWQEYKDGTRGWSDCLENYGGTISTSFCCYLKVQAMMANRGREGRAIRIPARLVAYMQVDCYLGGYGILSPRMVAEKRKQILDEDYASEAVRS